MNGNGDYSDDIDNDSNVDDIEELIQSECCNTASKGETVNWLLHTAMVAHTGPYQIVTGPILALPK